MKRLMKKAFGRTLWHGTNLSGFQSMIDSGGIYPNEQEGAGSNDAPDELFYGFSFFATSFDIAQNYANYAANNADPGVVIEVDVSEDALLVDDNDAPKAETWQQSMEYIQQVKISGPITTDYFKAITFFDINQNLIGEVPFSNWENFFYDKVNVIMGEEKAAEENYLDYSADDDDDIDFNFDDEEDKQQIAKNKSKRLLRQTRKIKKYSSLIAKQYIPNYPNGYEHVNVGVQTINVSDIIGMSEERSEEYDDNFKPIGEPDQRWKRIYERAKNDLNVDFAGPITIVKVPDEEKYFIYNDGNHRLSVAKELDIPLISAEVIELRSSNDEYKEEYEKIMKRIREINEKLQEMNIEQQKLYDSELSFSEADDKYEAIQKDKEPLIEEADKLWSDVENLKQNL